jgi:uncharacterized DUF497 family protein
MEFEWDEQKRQANIARHGIDFERAKEIWQGPVVEGPSPQTHHGEERFVTIGQSEGLIITVVFTWRGNVRRIISARAARRSEREDYQKKIG